MTPHRRRLVSMIAAGLTVAALAGCGQDEATQAAPEVVVPVAGSTPQPTPTPTAAAIPGFLAGTDLPKHPTSAWFTGKVTAGPPEFAPFCLEEGLPTTGQMWHRTFGTEFDTNATQVTVRAATPAAAQELAEALTIAAKECADSYLSDYSEATADWKDYGAPTPATHVVGVHTAVPESEHGAHLYGIGHDGSLVTVVRWGQMGDLSDAPIEAFETTTRTAVDKLS